MPDDEHDLEERVDRFYAAWTPVGASGLDPYLPPPGARHRRNVLVELILTDMGQRVRAGLPIRVEPYLARYPNDLPTPPPIQLITEEYLLRHRYADRPGVDEYRRRFPAVADALDHHLRNGSATATPPPPVPPPAAPRNGSISLGADHLSVAETANFNESLPPADKPPPPPADAEVLPADLQYTLGRRLGAGTFGEVYEAVAPGGGRVAIKRIHRAVDHPASKGEIAALDAMKEVRHPFLIQTHAYWVFRDRLVIVMELADGSLAGLVEQHKAAGRPGVPAAELIPVFEQAAVALDHLHAQNISHRDVKPENLLLLRGYAKVADFGLARVHEHQMTVVGAEVGTPCYMAPEVWRRKVSLHSDQYSLAATYVAARLGRQAFTATTLYELCHQHLNETPNLDPLPPAEQRVLLRALAKKPGDRYPNCRAFVQALRAAALPTARTRRWVLRAAVAASLGVGASAGLLPWLLSRPPVWSPPAPWTPPDGWRDDPATLPDGRLAPKLLTREVGGEVLELVLILPRPGTNDPPAFYMLRNKVTNRVYRAVWEKAIQTPGSEVDKFLTAIDRDQDVVDALLPKKWEEHAKRDDQQGVPVVGVTAVEAILVAMELGGQVPTKEQWMKATGVGVDTRPSPAGKPQTDAERNEIGGQKLSYRPLALGLHDDETSGPTRGKWSGGPWPVAVPTDDRSIHQIHQLISNGLEWADGLTEPARLNIYTQVQLGSCDMPLTGQTWETPVVKTFADILGERLVSPWTDTESLIGFRIVLTPR